MVAHEAARQRELLPLPERDLDAVGPGRPELRIEPGDQLRDQAVGAGADHGRLHGALVVESRHVADAHAVPRPELEAEEVLEGARQTRAPLVGRHAL